MTPSLSYFGGLEGLRDHQLRKKVSEKKRGEKAAKRRGEIVRINSREEEVQASTGSLSAAAGRSCGWQEEGQIAKKRSTAE